MTELTTRADAEQAIRRGARLTVLLRGAEAARDTAVLQAQKTNSTRITNISTELGDITIALAAWSSANRQEFTGQSLAIDAGSLNFRMGNRALEPLPRWSWKRVVKKMVRAGRVLAAWKSWIKIEFKIDKRKILSDSAGEKPKLTADKLASVGLKVVQDESFAVDYCVEQKL